MAGGNKLTLKSFFALGKKCLLKNYFQGLLCDKIYNAGYFVG